MCAAEDGDVDNLKALLSVTNIDLNKGNKVKIVAEKKLQTWYFFF
jgi:hypothetical protein